MVTLLTVDPGLVIVGWERALFELEPSSLCRGVGQIACISTFRRSLMNEDTLQAADSLALLSLIDQLAQLVNWLALFQQFINPDHLINWAAIDQSLLTYWLESGDSFHSVLPT
jgi:hypothetical protein